MKNETADRISLGLFSKRIHRQYYRTWIFEWARVLFLPFDCADHVSCAAGGRRTNDVHRHIETAEESESADRKIHYHFHSSTKVHSKAVIRFECDVKEQRSSDARRLVSSRSLDENKKIGLIHARRPCHPLSLGLIVFSLPHVDIHENIHSMSTRIALCNMIYV